ncbi:MAG: flavodoxin family protein [Deltaproteobacteria bacterium]|nr:MAG: flavodoxin family protein [Deltaproteobacteria bacterium]
MRVVGINGSPNKRGTYFLLQKTLEEVEKSGADTTLINLVDFNILPCKGCDKCVKGKECPQDDDVGKILEKLESSDAIIIATPTYWGNVSGILKNFMDRSRVARMDEMRLKNKVFAPIITSGLRNGGAEIAGMSLYSFGLGHGMICVSPTGNPVEEGAFVIGTLQSDSGWRSVKKDDIAVKAAINLGKRVIEVAKATKALRQR